MKKLLLLTFVFPTLFFAQESKKETLTKREKFLVKLLDKSYLHSKTDSLDKIYIAKKYNCLQYNYKIIPEEQKEFLTQKQLFKKFPDYQPETHITTEYISPFEGLFYGTNWENDKNIVFPKCVNTDDLKKLNVEIN